ncbi:MAG: hypothetical protein HC828_17480 [Blastochloris sp.]|nr:hypothetical protein [Blastochloris sp.]
MQESKEIDLTVRLVPWVFDEPPRVWMCDMPPNCVTLTPIINSMFWEGCLERPGRVKHYSPHFVKLDEALAWAEQEIIQAAEEARQPDVALPERQQLSLATLTAEQREQLAPFWIEPGDLEPTRRTYRAEIHFQHQHSNAKALELSFGQKFYYNKKYPTALQVAQKFHFNGNLVDIKDVTSIGIFHIASRTKYLDRVVALQEAQQLWKQSGLSSPCWSQEIEWAYFGVREEEIRYLEILGGIGTGMPQQEDRATYLANQAFNLTLHHTLNIDYWRANFGRAYERFSDEKILEIMHETRVESPVIPEAAREESRCWLKEHGHEPRKRSV